MTYSDPLPTRDDVVNNSHYPCQNPANPQFPRYQRMQIRVYHLIQQFPQWQEAEE